MDSYELQSKVFDFLRFPLIVGVVFIHNYAVGRGWNTLSDFQLEAPLLYGCSQLFSQIIGRISVPLFFIMSGYLFFFNTDFNGRAYIRKLKTRFRTLLLPYLFWNAAFLFVYLFIAYFLSDYIPFLGRIFNNTHECNIEYILMSFIGRAREAGEVTAPIAYQFWFIRSLIIIVVFTPLVYVYIKYTKWLGLAAVGVCWYMGLSIPCLGLYGFDTAAWLFFMLGAFFSINKKNMLTELSRFGNWIYLLYVVTAVMDLLTKGYDFNPYVNKFGILVGCICCFKLSAYLIEVKGIRVIPFLSAASFFVFAVHEEWILTTMRKIINMAFSPHGDFVLTLLYFGEVVFTVLTALALPPC